MGNGVDVEEFFADFATDEVLLDDLLDVGNLNGAVEGVFGKDFDEGALGAESEATDVVDGNLIFEAGLFDGLNQFFFDGGGIVG